MSIRVTAPNSPDITFEVRDLGGGQLLVVRTNKAINSNTTVLLDGREAERLQNELLHIELTNEEQRDVATLTVKHLNGVLLDGSP
jgi:hypothetical protein